MERDPLSDVLHSVRLTGAVFYLVDCIAPWVAETPPTRDMAGTLIPGAQHVFEFHALVAGECWAGPVGEEAIRLRAGDFVAFPRGEPHAMSSAPGMRAPPDPAIFAQAARLPRPVHVEYGQGDGARARLVCGFLGCDARPFNPLLDALPRVLHGSSGAGGEWLAHLVQVAIGEARERGPGSDSVLARVSELLFIGLVRRYALRLPPDQTGWLAGLRDAFVGKAIERLHARPADPWTLDRLAREVGLSRSALAERFTRLVGEPPMHYLTRWRMQLASLQLSTGASVQAVAGEVGYASEAAFSRAFKKVVGAPPATWAEARRGAGEAEEAFPA
ncbi:MAG TPA: AraC family transcriptional regulator [Anaeromyxobacter sp.]|nr:AraC family transcriptional regulator [Anaeromyxobacter sp.]